MKALFIITHTNEMHKHIDSFTCLNGNTADIFTYDHRRGRDDSLLRSKMESDIYEKAKESSPDIIVYIGACRSSTPSAQSFKKLRSDIAPTVHFCSDAADEPWWDELIGYDKEGSFDVQVAIDGNKNWPLAKTQITALTPISPSYYPAIPIPHEDRKVPFGFAGNSGGVHVTTATGRVGGRRPLIAAMMQFGLKCRERSKGTGDLKEAAESYKGCADYLSSCRITPNFPMTGSFNRMHVKVRVVEVGLAGGMLLEQKGSPTPDWFTPGVDYMEWGTMDEAREIVNRMKDAPEDTQAIGMSLRSKVIENHSPEKFWGRIFDHIGIK